MASLPNTAKTISPLEFNEFRGFELMVKQAVEGFITGLHRSPYHGFSVEFAEHKLYNPGESTRHVDWKVYAKTDRLYTKRYEEETNLRAMLMLDHSSSMYYPDQNNNKMAFSSFAAGCLAYLLQRQRDAVGLCTFSDQVEYLSQTKSTTAHLQVILGQLHGLLQAPSVLKKSNIVDVIHQMAETIHQRSLVVIFSDMLDNSEHTEKLLSALQHLRHNKHEVLLFHVWDKETEMDFQFEEKPYEFVDLETGERMKITPGEVKAAYKKQMTDFYIDLKVRCGQYKIDLVECGVNEGFRPVMLSFLTKRAKMHK